MAQYITGFPGTLGIKLVIMRAGVDEEPESLSSMCDAATAEECSVNIGCGSRIERLAHFSDNLQKLHQKKEFRWLAKVGKKKST